ncbi:hypothetical protein T03_13114 [Trichinella britovi]|uniref:Uncharacterized protein n=1 Tax=Trichinella britovi TaxID=45882 RepID=A0A0V1A4L3_TRIBR|nr:hypothetical protein T03_13114 [Trichinella britovi]
MFSLHHVTSATIQRHKLRERLTTLPLATAALETGFCALKPLTEDKL